MEQDPKEVAFFFFNSFYGISERLWICCCFVYLLLGCLFLCIFIFFVICCGFLFPCCFLLVIVLTLVFAGHMFLLLLVLLAFWLLRHGFSLNKPTLPLRWVQATPSRPSTLWWSPARCNKLIKGWSGHTLNRGTLVYNRNNGSLGLSTRHCFTSPRISSFSRLLIHLGQDFWGKKEGVQTVCPLKISNAENDGDVLETHQV